MAIDDILEPPSSNTGLIIEIPDPYVPPAPPVSSVTWNRGDQDPRILLTDNDLTCSSYSGYNGVRANAYLLDSNKAYWEYTIVNDSNLVGLGSLTTDIVSIASFYIDSFVTNFEGQGYFNSSSQFNIGNASWPATACYAVDTALDRLWVRINNGTWYPSGDPATGTGGFAINTVMRVALGLPAEPSPTVANFGDTPFAYTPPSGFTSYIDNSVSNVVDPTTTVALNALDKSPYVTLASGGLEASLIDASGTYYGIRANRRLATSTKSYFEFVIDSTKAIQVGLSNRTELFEGTVTAFSYGLGIVSYDGTCYQGGGGSFTIPSIPAGLYNASFAVDRVNNKAWIRVDGGTWYPSGDPASNTGGFTIDPIADIASVILAGNSGPASTIVNFGDTAFDYTPPSGFTAYKDSLYTETNGFDTANIGPGISLSNSNYTATQTSTPTGYSSVNASYSLPHTAKAYFEFTFDTNVPYTYIGFTNFLQTLTNTPTAFLDGIGLRWTGEIQQNGGTVETLTLTAGIRTFCIAIDMWAEKAWVRIDNGSWYPAASDPETNSGGYTITHLGNIAGVALSDDVSQGGPSGEGSATMNLGAVAFAQAVPSSFKSYLYYRDGIDVPLAPPPSEYPIDDYLEKSVTNKDLLLHEIPRKVLPDVSYTLTLVTV